MTEPDDHGLLAEFVRTDSERAFAELVARHVNLVYSAAHRFTGNPHHAQEISQAVFIILARKAKSLSTKIILSGWLYQTTRLTAANFLRGEIRRQQREQEAYMQSTLTETDMVAWQQIAPLLDQAMGSLGETDRNAVVLRFFENKTAREAGAALKLGEAAAHKRTERALEKLRKFFTKRGIALSAGVIAGAVSANSVQAAPVGLAVTISAIAIAKGAAAGGSTFVLAKGVLKIMAWTKMKMVMAVGASVLLAAGTATVVIEKIASRPATPKLPKLSATDLSWAEDPRYWEVDSQVLEAIPPVFILRPTRFQDGGSMTIGNSAAGHFKYMARNWDVRTLVTSAFNGYSQQRCVFPAGMPEEHYDLMFTISDNYQKRMKVELKSRFGLQAHAEKRLLDVWLLQIKVPGSGGLKISDGTRTDWTGSQYGAKIHNQQISNLTGWLEGYFSRPVLNRTGLMGNFDFNLNWKPKPGQSEKDALAQALLDQLGLELVPGREPIEMLIVEKTN